jgi:aryl-alcohol dehydrogenase-like predicted oxidoreductase
MRLTGRGVWGPPADRAECVHVVRRAIELGVQLIDTADSYGPHISEEIIAEAIHPYPEDLLIATKAGVTRNGPDIIDTDDGPVHIGPKAWPPLGRPEYLRQQAEMSLRRLRLERIDLFQLHRVDPTIPIEDQVGELAKLKAEGKIAAVGLSQVSVEQIEQAQTITEIATVQNRYNLTDRSSAAVLEYCEARGIGFIPWAPIATGALAGPGGPLDRIATKHQATPAQVALAWLLATSPIMLPIPGTAKVAHLEDNLAAATVRLEDSELAELG